MCVISHFIERLRKFLSWCWFCFWVLWFGLLGFLVYLLRGPLHIADNWFSVSVFVNTLTPKFYIALTGTSSLISGLILIFEWWYFRKYGTSFIEQLSLTHISPLLGVHEDESEQEPTTCGSQTAAIQECKVWRNPYSLFRGAEYSRLTSQTNKDPLTYYDMNLTAQDHQTFFTCEAEIGNPDYDLMMLACRERNPQERIKKAHDALCLNHECVTALILLAEEESPTILESEQLLRRAYKVLENQIRSPSYRSKQPESVQRRDTNALIYVKRRLAMCARRLGKLKDAIKLMKDLIKEYSNLNLFNIQENLLECYLEAQQYADAQAFLCKYDDVNYPKSATICYTAALLKTRQILEKCSLESASRKLIAIESIHRAVEFNPHVCKYLLEMKELILPPEHILKRGDSEALSYAFYHLKHWKNVDGALTVLQSTWEGAFRLLPCPLEKGHMFFPYSHCTETADRELLASFHTISVYPKKELPFFIIFTACICSATASLALLTYLYPEQMGSLMKFMVACVSTPISYILEKLESLWLLLASTPSRRLK